jgi:hypothetical protein
VGVADPDVLEYPNYSTAYALRCFVRAGAPADRELIERMRARLVSEQYAPDRGFDERTLVFGGWGFGGPRVAGRPGHMDLAHTRRVLEALREAGTREPTVFERALVFLRLMQRHPSESRPHPVPVTTAARPAQRPRFDGGFFFSPVVLDANKGAVLADSRGLYHGATPRRPATARWPCEPRGCRSRRAGAGRATLAGPAHPAGPPGGRAGRAIHSAGTRPSTSITWP